MLVLNDEQHASISDCKNPVLVESVDLTVSICDCRNPVLVFSADKPFIFIESISLCKNPVLVLNDRTACIYL